MKQLEKKSFVQYLLLLGEIFHRKMSPVLLEMYWSCLKPYPLSDVQAAMANLLENPESSHKARFFPTPSEWILCITGDPTHQSLVAWTEVRKAIRHIGQYDSVMFEDPLIHVVIQDMGGWIYVCQQPEKELPFLQKEFERRYRYVHAKNPSKIPHPLIGRLEHHNAIQGFKQQIPKPVLVRQTQGSKKLYLEETPQGE